MRPRTVHVPKTILKRQMRQIVHEPVKKIVDQARYVTKPIPQIVHEPVKKTIERAMCLPKIIPQRQVSHQRLQQMRATGHLYTLLILSCVQPGLADGTGGRRLARHKASPWKLIVTVSAHVE